MENGCGANEKNLPEVDAELMKIILSYMKWNLD